MKITVRLFAQMRLEAGLSQVEMQLPEGATLAGALDEFYRLRPELRSYAPTCLVAIGLDYSPLDRLLRGGEVISLIPPVQGG